MQRYNQRAELEKRVMKEIQALYGENASVSQTIDYLYSNHVIDPKSARNYNIRYEYTIRTQENGRSQNKAVNEIENEMDIPSGTIYSVLYA